MPHTSDRVEGATTDDRQSPQRHKRFYFPDGSIVFRADDVLFNVHRYLIQQYSRGFADMFTVALSDPAEGSSDDNPMILPQTSAVDFSRLLCIIYPQSFAQVELTTTEEWTSVLRLAHRPRVASLVDQIALARQYQLPGIVGRAARLLCSQARAEPLSLTETRRLGTDAGHVIRLLRERKDWVLLHDEALLEKRIMQVFDELNLDSI